VVFVASTSDVGLALSRLKKTRLLSFDASRVVSQQAQVLEDSSRIDIVGLDSISNCGHTSFTLSSGAATSHRDVHVKQTSVLRDSEREEDALSLRRQKEVLKQWLLVDGNFATSRLYVSDCNSVLALTRAPRFSNRVEFGLSFLMGQCSTQVEQVNAVELNVIVRVKIVVLPLHRHDSAVLVISLLGKMSAQVVLKEGILLQ